MIWATVIFGPLRITQKWYLLRDEIGHDSKPHDFILLLTTEERKSVVIMLETESINFDGPTPCYLGELHAGHAALLP